MVDLIVTVPDLTPERKAQLRALFRHGLTGVRVIVKGRTEEATEAMIRELAAMRSAGEFSGPIWLDLPGSRPRVSDLREGLTAVRTGTITTISDGSVPADLIVPHRGFIASLIPGARMSIADGTILLKVISLDSNTAKCQTLAGGPVARWRSLVVEGGSTEDFFRVTESELELAHRLADVKPLTVTLSWVSKGAQLRSVAGCFDDFSVLPKLESDIEDADLRDICQMSAAILIGRADLTAIVGPGRVRSVVDRYIAAARNSGTPVFVGSHLMDSLEQSHEPGSSDVSDIERLLKAGVVGLLVGGSGSKEALARKVAAVARSIRENTKEG